MKKMLTELDWQHAYKNRKDRLKRLLDLEAPEVIIANECLLVVRAAAALGKFGTGHADLVKRTLADVEHPKKEAENVE